MQLKVVLLPEPLGPMRPRISPSSTWKETLETAVKPLNVLVRPETVRRGMRLRGQTPRDDISFFTRTLEARV